MLPGVHQTCFCRETAAAEFVDPGPVAVDVLPGYAALAVSGSEKEAERVAQAVGVPLWIARLGAHLNNMKFAKGKPDSPDDQLSISAGYHFAASIDVVK